MNEGFVIEVNGDSCRIIKPKNRRQEDLLWQLPREAWIQIRSIHPFKNMIPTNYNAMIYGSYVSRVAVVFYNFHEMIREGIRITEFIWNLDSINGEQETWSEWAQWFARIIGVTLMDKSSFDRPGYRYPLCWLEASETVKS